MPTGDERRGVSSSRAIGLRSMRFCVAATNQSGCAARDMAPPPQLGLGAASRTGRSRSRRIPTCAQSRAPAWSSAGKRVADRRRERPRRRLRGRCAVPSSQCDAVGRRCRRGQRRQRRVVARAQAPRTRPASATAHAGIDQHQSAEPESRRAARRLSPMPRGEQRLRRQGTSARRRRARGRAAPARRRRRRQLPERGQRAQAPPPRRSSRRRCRRRPAGSFQASIATGGALAGRARSRSRVARRDAPDWRRRPAPRRQSGPLTAKTIPAAPARPRAGRRAR